MTASTGKRSFRACLRCRRRKTKCDLDGSGDRKEPPCRSCHLSGNDCVLVQSRRGQGRNKATPDTRDTATDIPEAVVHRNESAATSSGPSSTPLDADDLTITARNLPEPYGSGRETEVKLRNPSDALEILARSDERSLLASTRSPADHAASSAPSIRVTENRLTELGDFELLTTGALQMSVILELLQKYTRIYHPHYPIAPDWLLSPRGMDRIGKSEHFLLTVLLTVASQDSTQHVLVHRYCWDHAQRLLLDVLLARSSTQTPRTVEGLLILAEWLPHIESKLTAKEAPGDIFAEDRRAWSLIGLAIRQGYMLRLDRGAFRRSGIYATQEQSEQERLLWHFVCLADRHISVRLGQSFWSRGPSLSSHFTADDFPSLKPKFGDFLDQSAILQANLELVQILYNAHLILYASTERTQALIKDGDYARYLDDFLSAATMWQTTWGRLDNSSVVSNSVFMTYEYVCLYVNAFSFQAVVARSVKDSRAKPQTYATGGATCQESFRRSTLSLPDGLYINGAIRAATKLLERMTTLDPQGDLQYLPSRFFLYGVYAAVFLYKVVNFDMTNVGTQLNAIDGLISRLISVMQGASAAGTHVCHTYSRMLGRLWRCRDPLQEPYRRPFTDTEIDPDRTLHGPFVDLPSSTQSLQDTFLGNQISEGVLPDVQFASTNISSSTWQDPWTSCNDSTLPSWEELTVDHFWPGITDFSQLMDPSIGV